MCLILIKPQKIKFNDNFLNIVERAFRGNNDGSSVAILRPRTECVTLKRGLMTAKATMESVENMDPKEDDVLVIHLRMATQGSAVPENTHGFTVSSVAGDFEKIEGNFYNTFHIFHNGGFSGQLARAITDAESDFSDTKLVTKNLFAKKSSHNKSFAELMYEQRRICVNQDAFNAQISSNFPAIGFNKIAILSGKYGLLTVNSFYTDDNGYLHSNQIYTNKNAY